MNFGKSILEKYGWKEGESLGKNNDGITQPIKVHKKTNLAGLGADQAKDISGNFWWERVFDEAANNLTVVSEGNGDVTVVQKEHDCVEITNKSFSVKKLKQTSTNMIYNNFIKVPTLLNEVNEELKKSEYTKKNIPTKPMTDEELFNACGGLTAHKGARHGLKQSGKLARLQQQDKLLSGLENFNAQVSIIKPIMSKSDQESDDELIEKALFCHEYSKKGKSKIKKIRKVEANLVAEINSSLNLSDQYVHNDEENIAKSSTSSKQKGKKLHEKKKLLETPSTSLETSASSVKNNLKKINKRKILNSDSEDDQNSIDAINEKMEFLHKLKKQKQSKTKRRRLNKKYEKIDQLTKKLDISD